MSCASADYDLFGVERRVRTERVAKPSTLSFSICLSCSLWVGARAMVCDKVLLIGQRKEGGLFAFSEKFFAVSFCDVLEAVFD